MKLRFSRRLKLRLRLHPVLSLVVFSTAGALVATTGVFTSTASTACACGATGVTANPDIYNFSETKVGGPYPKETIVYTNHGPGNWTFTGAKFDYLNKEKEPGFTYKQGATKPCNAGAIGVGASCELIVEFTPSAKESYDAYFEAEPNAEMVIVTGKGK